MGTVPRLYWPVAWAFRGGPSSGPNSFYHQHILGGQLPAGLLFNLVCSFSIFISLPLSSTVFLGLYQYVHELRARMIWVTSLYSAAQCSGLSLTSFKSPLWDLCSGQVLDCSLCQDPAAESPHSSLFSIVWSRSAAVCVYAGYFLRDTGWCLSLPRAWGLQIPLLEVLLQLWPRRT